MNTWLGAVLGLSFGNLIVMAFIPYPSLTSYVLSLVLAGLAWLIWMIHLIRSSRNDTSPIPLEGGDKPEFIVWRDGLYQRTGEKKELV